CIDTLDARLMVYIQFSDLTDLSAVVLIKHQLASTLGYQNIKVRQDGHFSRLKKDALHQLFLAEALLFRNVFRFCFLIVQYLIISDSVLNSAQEVLQEKGICVRLVGVT